MTYLASKQKAEIRGQQAFREGLPSTAALDPGFFSLIDGLPIGKSAMVIIAWRRGWARGWVEANCRPAGEGEEGGAFPIAGVA